MSADPEILYFGCIGQPGHNIICKRSIVRVRDTPWGNQLDGGLLSHLEPQHHRLGVCIYATSFGWSVVSFWDRSGDTRPNSNSAFLVREVMPPERLIELARQQWPEIFNRTGFPDLSYQPVFNV